MFTSLGQIFERGLPACRATLEDLWLKPAETLATSLELAGKLLEQTRFLRAVV